MEGTVESEAMLEDEFCDIIKKARTGLGLDPNQVARDTGLSAPALRELEAGQRAPTREEVHALAAALRLDGAKLAAIACDGWHPRHPIANTVQDVITIHGDIGGDRKSTRLNSSHSQISYAVFCLKKKKKTSMQTHKEEISV